MSNEIKLNLIRDYLFKDSSLEIINNDLHVIMNHIKESLIYNRPLSSEVKDEYIVENIENLRSEFLLFIAKKIQEREDSVIMEEIRRNNISLFDIATEYAQELHLHEETLTHALRDLERKKIKKYLSNLNSDEIADDPLFETDLSSSLAQLERVQIKEKLKKIGASHNNKRVIKMIFYSLAVAASVIGVIFFVSNIVNNSDKNSTTSTVVIQPKTQENENDQMPRSINTESDRRKEYAIEFKTVKVKVDEGNGSVNLGYSPNEIPNSTEVKTIKYVDIDALVEKMSKSNLSSLEKAYHDSLISLKSTYIYDGKTITIYKNPGVNVKIKNNNGQTYLFLDNIKYKLIKSNYNRQLLSNK